MRISVYIHARYVDMDKVCVWCECVCVCVCVCVRDHGRDHDSTLETIKIESNVQIQSTRLITIGQTSTSSTLGAIAAECVLC